MISAACALGGTALAPLLSVALRNPAIGFILVACMVLAVGLVVWIWQQPVRGVYVLFGAAVLLATYVEAGLTDYIGAYLPFFQDIKSWPFFPPDSSWRTSNLIFSVAEIFMAMVFIIWLVKGVAERNLRFNRGSLMLPLGLYMVMVLVGEGRGVTSGGPFRDSLFEVRSQAYLLVAYILVCNLVKNRSHVQTLLWILLIGAGLRGIEGTFQYLFVLRAEDMSAHQLYPHEQSYFFNGFLTLTVILFVYGGTRRMKRVALLLAPFEIIGELANNRRASIAALCICLLVLFLVTWVVRPQYRRVIGWSLFVFAAIYAPYYMVYQNKTGLLALPARAISSNFHPIAADASSNQYRVFEDLDIMATVKSSSTTAVIGYGFGKPMLNPYPLPNIGYVWQYIMPHNSILWIWMRLGTIGYVFLWFLIGTAIVQAAQLVRRLQDRFLQGMILFVLVMLLQQVIISYVDLQWSNYRTMIVTGMLFALISRLAAIAQAEKRLRAGSQPMPGIHARARSGLQAADRGVMAGYSRAVASLSAGRERERSLALPRLSVIQGETGVPSAERECTGPTAGAVSALRASGGAVDHLAGLDTMPDAAGISLFAAAGVPLYQVQAGAAEAETTVQESFAETGLLGRLDAWKGSELAEWSFVPRERLLPEAEVLDLIPEDNL